MLRRGGARGRIALAAAAATEHPRPISARELAKPRPSPTTGSTGSGPASRAISWPPPTACAATSSAIGDSVYYGDCVKSKGIFGGGSCELPLQVTTVIYRLHSNAPLGPQRNIVVRGVPATIYDEGRSIEIYTGRVAIDVFSDTLAHALRAARELRRSTLPVSATGHAAAARLLPGPVRARDRHVAQVMAACRDRPASATRPAKRRRASAGDRSRRHGRRQRGEPAAAAASPTAAAQPACRSRGAG